MIGLPPILERELIVASRRRETYSARTVGAFMAVVLCAFLSLTLSSSGPSIIMGPILFQFLIWITFIYSLTQGINLTADCISVEKRDGTLGLLFLTDLKGRDVVLGKLASTSLCGFYALLAMIPALSISLLMGGVTLSDFVRASLALMNSMFFAMSVGIMASTFCWQAKRSSWLALLILVAFNLILPMCVLNPSINPNVAAQYPPGFRTDFLEVLSLFSPAIQLSYYSATAKGGNHYYASWVCIHALSWIFLAVASAHIKKSWQDKPASLQKQRWRDRFRQWAQGDYITRTDYRQDLLQRNPIHWLTCRDRIRTYYVWLNIAIILAVFFSVFGSMSGNSLEGIAMIAVIVNHVPLKFWFASAASEPLAEGRRSGSLELLLSTALTTQEIFSGLRMTLERVFLRPGLVVLGLDLFLIIALAHLQHGGAGEVCIVIICSMIFLVTDLFAMSWMGLWQGITAKSAKQASSNTMALVVFLPCVVFGGILALGSVASLFFRWNLNLTFPFVLLLWFALGAVNAILQGLFAKHMLLRTFRARAAIPVAG